MSSGYVLAGYGITVGSLGLYAVRVLRRGRALARSLPGDVPLVGPAAGAPATPASAPASAAAAAAADSGIGNAPISVRSRYQSDNSAPAPAGDE